MVFTLVISVIIFTTAAICNMCQPAGTTEVSESDSQDTAGSPVEETEGISEQQTQQAQESQAQEESTATTPEAANSPPEISQIILPSTDMKVDKPYDIEVAATDADGDSLTYVWSVSDGTIDDPALNPMTWTTPGSDGTYEITVTVDDGRDTDTDTESVTIYPLPPPIVNIDVPIDEAGSVAKDIYVCSDPICNIEFGDFGDFGTNRPVRGFISFDIRDLAGATVTNAALTFDTYMKRGDPASLITGIWVEVVNWGDDPTDHLVLSDYDLPGNRIRPYLPIDPVITVDPDKLKTELQSAIDNGMSRFQLRIRHRGWATNNNNNTDC